MDLQKTIDNLIGREGKYSNHPSDPGGETMWGITAVEARANGYAGSMRNMPRDKAEDIYRKKYWHRPGFDDVAARLPSVAEELLDTGVNMGPKVASKFLQLALNALNGQGKLWHDIEADGDIGPMTLYALDHMIAKRGAIDTETVLLRALNGQQLTRYLTIADKNKRLEDFMFGWIMQRVQ